MDKLEIQKLRDLPIEGVAERLGLNVKHHKVLCPFHDDHTPSLSFNVRKNTYRCFVCGASGDGISLVMNYLHKDFLEACRWLADENNIILSHHMEPETIKPETPITFDASRYERFFERPFLNDAAKHFLFDERKLDPRVITWCRLTSWRDKNGVDWLQIPYYNKDGKLIGIQNRCLAPAGALPRFRFPTGSRCSIYNLPILNLLKPGEDLYITEGASDCWSMLSSGHKAIAIPSATLLNPQDIQLLITHTSQLKTPLHMYPDRDLPGERLFLQLKELLPALTHHQLPPTCKDFSDYYRLRVIT